MDWAQTSVRTHPSRIRACENCNRRKKKCNGGQPKCHLCILTGAICTYPRFSLKPGPKKGSKRARRDIGGPADVRRPPETPGAIAEDRAQSLVGDERWLLSDITTRCPTSSPSSSTPQVLDADQSPEGRSLSNQSRPRPTRDRPHHQIQSQLLSHPPREADPLLPPQEHLNHLMEVYFDFVHPQIRILHRPSFLSWVQSDAFVADRGSSLLLSAMCGLAARYSDQPEVDLFDRSLSQQSESDSGPRHSGYRRRKRWERGKGFLDHANRLFQSEISRIEKSELDSGTMQKPSIRFVQAAALLGFAEAGFGVTGRAYSIISTSVRLAYDCGLNQMDQYDTAGAKHVGVDAGDARSNFVKKEEFRRVWWAISDLENFICTTKHRPRMIDWETCKTKLPCDDKDWFAGHECPSFFLPATLSDLQTSLDLTAHISVMAYRILAAHLLAKFMKLALDDDGVTLTHGALSTIEECAVVWKPKDVLPEVSFRQAEGDDEMSCDSLPLRIQIETQVSLFLPRCTVTDQNISILLLLGKIRMFKAATPSTFFHYCEDMADGRSNSESSPENSIVKTLGSQAFSAMLSASDAICSAVRDWSTHSIARSCPFIVVGLWAPACLQLLVKSFAGAGSALAEKASLSLRILTMAMEQFAEFSGIGQSLLDSFRMYEQKLTNLNWSDEGHWDMDQLVTRRLISLPDYVDASFLKGLSPTCSPDAATALDNSAGLEDQSDPTSGTAADSVQLTTFPWYFPPDKAMSYDQAMEDWSWMEVEWANTGGVCLT